MLAWWLWRKLGSVPRAAVEHRGASPLARALVWGFLAGAGVLAAAESLIGWQGAVSDLVAVRQAAKIAGAAAMQGVLGAALGYCVIWKVWLRNLS